MRIAAVYTVKTTAPAKPDVARLVHVIDGMRKALNEHDSDCGDKVAGVAVNPDDHAELGLVEVWGVPVLGWEDVQPGRFKLLCDAYTVLIPDVETADELLDRWTYHL